MKKDLITVIALIGFCISLASCGGEPAGDHTQPEATQGDYIRHDDIDSAEIGTDTARTDNTEVDNMKREEH